MRGMAKVNSVRVNMRLRDEARFALEELAERMGCSQTAVVERAVLEAHKRVSSGSEVEVEPRRGAVAPPLRAEIAIICRHCKEPFGGQKFQAPLCGDCKRVGHRGDLHECPVCVDYGTGAL